MLKLTDDHVLSIRLPAGLADAAKEQAAIEDRSLASLIRLALAGYIAEQRAKDRAAS